MGLARKSTTIEKQEVPAVQPDGTQTPVESGAAAAVARLKTARTENAKPAAYNQYDPSSVNDDKSRRILRQGVYQHVSVSPSVAGMKWDGADQFVDLVSEIAEKLIRRIEG